MAKMGNKKKWVTKSNHNNVFGREHWGREEKNEYDNNQYVLISLFSYFEQFLSLNRSHSCSHSVQLCHSPADLAAQKKKNTIQTLHNDIHIHLLFKNVYKMCAQRADRNNTHILSAIMWRF